MLNVSERWLADLYVVPFSVSSLSSQVRLVEGATVRVRAMDFSGDGRPGFWRRPVDDLARSWSWLELRGLLDLDGSAANGKAFSNVVRAILRNKWDS